jgi:hypothetical protein
MEGESSKNTEPKKSEDSMDFSIANFDNTQLNSTGKFDAELIERCAPLDKAIKDLSGTENPSIKDISVAIICLLNSQKEALAEQIALKKQLFSMTKKVVENAHAIKNMQEGFSSDVLHLSAKFNQLEQLRIDDEICIGGFPSKPDPNHAKKELCKIFNIPTSAIYRCYSYEFKNKRTKKIEGQLVLKFNCKTDHISFNKLKREIGTIYVPQLMVNPSVELANNPAKIFNRLTPTNRSIIAMLRMLQKEGKILKDGIRYRNCSFEAKLAENTDFQPVPSKEHLARIFK